ncbi:MAG: PLDc N-terminal domain-containing protein [Candidatus Izimaplasma sp.]|nr:PLDc N-terminal domain-containing protein [Candidatus Izimaplasma bacterium]
MQRYSSTKSGLLIIPIILIDLIFRIYAIVDIINEERKVKGGNKVIWIIVIAIVNYGWVIYFVFGKDE